IEALMRHCKIPAGFLREKFGFESLPDFEIDLWRQVKLEADKQIEEFDVGLIAGSDISAAVTKIAKSNLSMLPGGDRVQINIKHFSHIEKLADRIIVGNPPYGIRQGNKDQISSLYRQLGDFLKQRCQRSTAYLYFGDRSLIPSVGLKPAWRKPLSNGGLDGRLVRFDIY
ncbi:MAG: class I SAM-dependent RNA methyltransferase, partial [bacterium]|nr:class I SAM-dependent RNA methyltransferase [bacterium]